MPKVSLEFSLPEEQEEFEQAHLGPNYMLVLEDLDNYLRSKLKYTELTDEESRIYLEVQTKLHQLREKWGV